MKREQKQSMQESYLNETCYGSEDEAFSSIQVPPNIHFFARLDGWKFKKLTNKLNAEKPFDRRLAQCLVKSAKAVFQSGMNPVLIYVASDELNILFGANVPFRGRVEKINSVLAGIVSSVFSIAVKAAFGENVITAFDSRIILTSDEENIIKYLNWRQADLWRNHNNAYAYWMLRKKGYGSTDVAKKLQKLKTKELHQLLFQEGINLAKTPAWQRRGILIYREPYVKQMINQKVVRWKLVENWDLPLFTTEKGKSLLTQIFQWSQSRRKI